MDLGIVDEDRKSAFRAKMKSLWQAKEMLSTKMLKARVCATAGLPLSRDGRGRSALELLSIPGVSHEDLGELVPGIVSIESEIMEQIEREAVYANHLERQEREANFVLREEGIEIPTDFDFGRVRSLSSEVREKLGEIQPRSIAAARKIEGITPVAINALLLELRARTAASRQRP